MRVIILGSGSSAGTPAVGGGWGKCDPDNPRNRRTRPSIVVDHGATRILIDTSPDLRQQLLDHDVSSLNAVLYTHAHADHLHGIDDLRGVNRVIERPLPAYGSAKTLEEIAQRFAYALKPLDPGARFFYKPTLEPHEIADGDRFQIGDLTVIPFDQDHGFSRTLGFRIGPMAYSTDVVELPEHVFTLVAGVRLWIIGTLVDEPHPTHCHVSKALSWLRRAGVERGVLTHLGNDLDYARLSARLPEGVEPAYDGMIVDLGDAG